MSHIVNTQMQFRKVKRIPVLKSLAPYLIGGSGLMKHAVDFMKIEDFNKMNWNVESIADGLNYLNELEYPTFVLNYRTGGCFFGAFGKTRIVSNDL